MTTAYSAGESEARLVGAVIDKWRLSNGWSPLPLSDQIAMVAAWFEILESARVPARMYNACYLSAMQRRAELKAEGKELSGLTVDDLVAEWSKIRRVNDEINSTQKLLPENAGAACQRCFGTGKEEMPDGSVRPDCRHLPLTREERRERAQAKARQIEFIREAVKKVGAPKPAVSASLVAPRGERFQCSACGRVVNSLGGWRLGETCKALFVGPTLDGDLLTCRGQMVTG